MGRGNIYQWQGRLGSLIEMGGATPEENVYTLREVRDSSTWFDCKNSWSKLPEEGTRTKT